MIGSVIDVPLEALQPHPRNARRGDVDAIVSSIEANGLYRPLIVQRSSDYIIAGNHTFRALAKLGRATAPVLYLDVDDEAALRILLVDNRTSDLATYDDALLTDLLAELAVSAGEALLGTGYTADDLAALRRELDTSLHLADGATRGQDPTERAGEWANSDVRQIVLVLSAADFAHAIGLLAEMQRRDASLDTNTACILRLADRWAADEGWEPPSADAPARPD